jgi:hypothetical protein
VGEVKDRGGLVEDGNDRHGVNGGRRGLRCEKERRARGLYMCS